MLSGAPSNLMSSPDPGLRHWQLSLRERASHETAPDKDDALARHEVGLFT